MDEDQKARQEFLARHGVNANNQQIAVHTLQSIQTSLVHKIDQICIYYIKRFYPLLVGFNEQTYAKRLAQLNIAFEAASVDREPVTGWNRIVFVSARKEKDKPVVKRAFEVKHRILPILEHKGQLKLEVEHQEIPFPDSVKIQEAL